MLKARLWIVLSICLFSAIFASGTKGNHSGLSRVIGDTARMNINNIDLPMENNGSTGNDGQAYYPNGQTLLSFLFSGGFALTGLVNGSLDASWMAPSSIIEEWQPGKWGMDPNNALARFYKVSANDGPGSQAYIDWTDAVSLGADFIDLNGDGIYDPYVDKPALIGHKTVWTVFNDNTVNTYPGGLGTPPLGLEIQQMAWAYSGPAPLKDVIFFWLRLINTGGNQIDSLIYSVWEDPDIGDFTDDLVGCDTTLNLGYCYNDAADPTYGSNPPAFGIKLLQGPLISSPGDTAFLFREPSHGIDTLLDKKNLPMTSFMYYVQGGALLPDPNEPEVARIYQMGGLDHDGNPLNPPNWGIGGTSTSDPNFFYSGDPVNGTGWRDDTPADKRFLVNSGPFNLAAGDTQDIVFVYVVGQGSNALNSISVLRQRTAYLSDFFPYGRLLNIAVSDTLIPIDSTFRFQAVLSSINSTDSIQSVTWNLTAQPVGSNSQIIPGAGYTAVLDPDLPGGYSIRLEAIITGNTTLIDTITVTAVDNNPPVAQLSITPEEIVFGNAAMADARTSFDPDGDALTYSWLLPEWISALFPDTGIVSFTPLHTGTGEITVTVNDSYFMHSTTESFTVIPDSNDLKTLFHMSALENIAQIQLVDGKVFANSPGSNLYVFDAGVTPGQINSYSSGGSRFATDGNLMASGFASVVILYIIDSNFQPVYAAEIAESVLQYNGRFFDLYFRSAAQQLLIPAAPRDLRVYDVSDPYFPNLINSYALPPLTRDMVFEGDLAAFFSQYPTVGLVMIDLSTLTALDSLPLPGQIFTNIEMSGNRIYLLQGSVSGTTVQIVDATLPNNLQLAGVINVDPVLPGMGFGDPILEMEAKGDTLLLGLKDGILLYDVSDPYNPREIAGFRSGLEVLGMAWDGPLLYLAERGDLNFGAGYYVLGYDSTITGTGNNPPPSALPATFKLFQNYPNPFNPTTTIRFGLPIAARVRLEIFNILGQRVKTLVDGNGLSNMKAGWHEMQWDGRSDAGKQVASGVYFYRLQADGFVQSRKMILLR